MGNSVSNTITAAGKQIDTVLHSLKLNLAPTTQIADGNGIECPICFLTYQLVNDVDCCHQVICTGMYVLIIILVIN